MDDVTGCMFINEERENDNARECIISEAVYLSKKWYGISAQMKELMLGAGTSGTEKAEYRLIV